MGREHGSWHERSSAVNSNAEGAGRSANLAPPEDAQLESVALAGGWRYALPILLVLYLLLGGIHAAVVPVGRNGSQDAPDEAAHISYVKNIASGHLPSHSTPTTVGGESPGAAYEWHQPPLYYIAIAPFSPLGGRGMRLGSLFMGVCCLLVIYRAGRLLFPTDHLAAVVAVGIAALTPTHFAITSAVNNDVLIELCFSGTLCLLILALKKGFSKRVAVQLGAVLGSAILTKVTGLLLLPVFGFALLLFYQDEKQKPVLLKRAGVTFGVLALVCGWWFIRNQVLYSQLLPLKLFAEQFEHTAQAAVWAERVGGWGPYLVQMCLGTFLSFWAVYGSPDGVKIGAPSFLPPQIYQILGCVSSLGLIGLVRLHLQRRRIFSREQNYGIWLLFATAAIVGASYLTFILRYFQMQGRYLFPAMLPICLILSISFRVLFPERWKSTASLLLLVLLGVVDLAYLKYLMP